MGESSSRSAGEPVLKYAVRRVADSELSLEGRPIVQQLLLHAAVVEPGTLRTALNMASRLDSMTSTLVRFFGWATILAGLRANSEPMAHERRDSDMCAENTSVGLVAEQSSHRHRTLARLNQLGHFGD